jgi:hypothetical protein
MQKWNKLGLIFECKHNDALPYYAAVPFAKHLNGDIFRVYYSGRDRLGRSFISSFDLNIETLEIVNDEFLVYLNYGKLGAFDDAGAVLFQILNVGEEDWMYYSGWTLASKVPFRFNIGLAKSQADRNLFQRFSEGPIVGQTVHDPYLAGAPWIIVENGIWKMWYISCTKWEIENDTPKHYYKVMYTESLDGINWNSERRVVIDFKDNDEFAIARPQVIIEDNIYKMWYSYRGIHYKIGYAESYDGITWTRKDEEVNIPVSKDGWDSEMICYGFVLSHMGQKYMLYNGNGYGKSGIGLAKIPTSYE